MKWFRGYIICCVKCGCWERFMNLCRHHRIKLWNVNVHECHVTFCMYSRDYVKVKMFVAKTHVVPHICEKRGLPFLMEQAVRDWTFTMGLLMFFALLKVLSLFVWQINYYGQREYTKETVSKEVTSLGVYPGMLRKNLNCDSIERSLRESYENMSWVSAEEKGCVLNIKIKEGKAGKKKEENAAGPCHVTAPCDGTIQSIVTRAGTPKVGKGAVVKKGDILISGVVEIKDDSGETVRYNGVCADGEITIVTEEKFEDSINVRHVEKNKTGKDIRVYTVDLNGTRFSLKNPLKWFDNSASYDIINNVCVDREFIPLDMRLKITERKYICYEAGMADYNEKQAADILGRRFLSKLSEYEENGRKIIDKSLKVKKEKTSYQAEGRIKMMVSGMTQIDVTSEELTLPDKGKEDDDGTGAVNS